MKQLIDPQIEQVLQETIFPDLLKGRKDFDLPHTKAVVYWMKHLLSTIPNTQIDSQVLITAAYAHDWGYIGLFDGIDSNDPKEIAKKKPLHMERGAEFITNLIETKLSQFFTEEQKKQVAHLVFMHDRVEKLATEEELLIMEADTLGMLDAERAAPTFSKEDNDLFVEKEVKNRRIPKFFHSEAVSVAQKLIVLRQHYFDSP